MRTRSRALFLPLLGLLFLGFIVPRESSAAPAEARKPNILFLFADDLTCDGVRAFGGKDVQTPNLDKLAARGTMFTHAYNMGAWNGAVCIASRAMLMTGRSLWHAKAVSGKPELAAENAAGRLWPGMMRAAGYRTCMTGKWHNEIAPEDCFEVVSAPRIGGMPSDKKEWYNRPPADGGEDTWNPADPTLGGYWEGGRHWTEVAAENAISFINESAEGGSAAGRPFFAYVAFNAPHDPRQSPQEFLDLYQTDRITVPENFLPVYPYRDAIGLGPDLRDEALAPFPRTPHAVQVHRREYFALVSHLDAWIGKILEAVEKSGQADRTFIVFTADHGLALGRHGFMGKQSLYDHSTRVPLILAGPSVPSGGKVNAPIYLQDAMATTLEVAGAAKPGHVEWQSLLPFLKPDATAQGRPVIYGADLERQRSITADGWKLLAYPKVPVLRLYHLAEDPLEMKDLAGDPDQQARMREMFVRLREEQNMLNDPLDLRVAFPGMSGPRSISATDLDEKTPEALIDQLSSPVQPAIQHLEKAHAEFEQGLEKLTEAYRMKLAEAVGMADRVEIFLLKKTENPPAADDPFLMVDLDKWFLIAPYKSYEGIGKKKLLAANERGRLIAKIKEMLEHPGTVQAMCHHPVHGIRCFAGDSLIFETSLCYSCRNFYLCDPRGANWLALPDNGLKELMLELMPLAPDKAKKKETH